MWRRLKALVAGEQLDRELNAEVKFHLDMEAEKYVRQGLDPAAAARFLEESSAAPARLTAPPSGLFLERVYYEGDPRDPEVRPAIPVNEAGATPIAVKS